MYIRANFIFVRAMNITITVYSVKAISFYDFIDLFNFSPFENNQFYMLYYSLLPRTVHCVSHRCEVLFNLKDLVVFILFLFFIIAYEVMLF